MDGATSERTGHRRRNGMLRVSQAVSACSFCKSRKIKCDGLAPACGCCTKFGRASLCSLADGGTRHSCDYVTYLQNRIQQLREVLDHGGSEVPPIPTAAGGTPASAFSFNTVDSSQEQFPQQQPSHQHNEQIERNAFRHQQSTIDTLIADIGALPISTSSYASSSDGPTLSTVLLAAAGKVPLLPLSVPQPSESALPDIPEQSTALKLAQHYIQQVYPRLPFFSIQGFWAQFHHVYARSRGAVDGSPDVATAAATNGGLNSGYSYFTVLMVLAISTSSLSRSADSMISNQAQRLFQAGLQFRESAILPNTIIGVQSLLFLIQFATLNPSMLDAWYLIGVGMRNCVDLGLHQDPQPLDSVSPSLLETRRRLWWSMYSFDRSMSIGCGRPTEIADVLIHVQLPSFRIESNADEVEIEGYLQRYRALQLQSEIYDTLNHSTSNASMSDSAAAAAVDDLRNRLRMWQDANCPDWNSQTVTNSEWFMGKILLFRPCRLVPERSTQELKELWASARGFISMYRLLVESNSIFYVQIACEKVYWTGLISLHSYWRLHALDDGQASDRHQQPLDLWKIIKDITFILQTLSERWEDGKILSTKFDSISARVIELLDDIPEKENFVDELPMEVVALRDYASLTSIWASSENHVRGVGADQDNEELQHLVTHMM